MEKGRKIGASEKGIRTKIGAHLSDPMEIRSLGLEGGGREELRPPEIPQPPQSPHAQVSDSSEVVEAREYAVVRESRDGEKARSGPIIMTAAISGGV